MAAVVTPKTKAGRAVWQEIEDAIESGGGQHVSAEDICLIEREAAEQGRERIRYAMTHSGLFLPPGTADRIAAILAEPSDG